MPPVRYRPGASRVSSSSAWDSSSRPKAVYERAKAGGSYDRVERWFGNGRPNTKEKAYAMTSPMECFAETTEAFFSRNDFFPFTRDELKQHHPEMFKLLEQLWNPTLPSLGSSQVKSPPPELKLPTFYKKYLEADGYTKPGTRLRDHLARWPMGFPHLVVAQCAADDRAEIVARPQAGARAL